MQQVTEFRLETDAVNDCSRVVGSQAVHRLEFVTARPGRVRVSFQNG